MLAKNALINNCYDRQWIHWNLHWTRKQSHWVPMHWKWSKGGSAVVPAWRWYVHSRLMGTAWTWSCGFRPRLWNLFSCVNLIKSLNRICKAGMIALSFQLPFLTTGLVAAAPSDTWCALITPCSWRTICSIRLGFQVAATLIASS